MPPAAARKFQTSAINIMKTLVHILLNNLLRMAIHFRFMDSRYVYLFLEVIISYRAFSDFVVVRVLRWPASTGGLRESDKKNNDKGHVG